MQRLGITQSLADSLEDAAHSNTSTPQRLNASTKLYRHCAAFVRAAFGLKLPLKRSRPGTSRPSFRFSGKAAGARMLSQEGEIPIPRRSSQSGLSQEGEIPIRGRSGQSGLVPTRRALTPPVGRLILLSVLLLYIFLPAPAGAATARGGASRSAKPAAKSAEIPLHCPAKFVTALLVGPRGGTWVAGEDTGIYHRRAIGHSWKRFDKSNSPGLASDSIYCLCIDSHGRLWAGTNRRGVCVFNGRTWRHYGLATGPLGSHVIAISCDPRDGSAWMCTENGLSIYMPGGCGTKKALYRMSHADTPEASPLILGRWRYISRLQGLPANPDCLAFNRLGTAFVGTLCGGLAIAAYPYTHWRVIHGPWHTPITATGRGLPSNLVNCVVVGHHGNVYVGTDRGVAVSTDNGQSFRYERGMDYARKVLGLWHPPIGFAAPPAAFLRHLLPGDHITCLARGNAGNIWLGTWRNGYAKINTRNGKIIQSQFLPGLSQLDGYVSQLAVAPDGSLLVARYGLGLSELKLPKPTGLDGAESIKKSGHAARRNALLGADFPRSATPPHFLELPDFSRVLHRATRQASHIRYPYARFLRNDWRTQGDWTARYGREYGVLCAAHFDLSFHVSAPDYAANVDAFCGPHHRWPFESMREWESSADTHNPKSLYIPQLGYRRQTNWDDHGETYPTTFQGPDLWIRVHLKKAGIYRLSLYLFNKDGHVLYNRQRDWLVEVYPLPQTYCQPMTRPLLSAMVFPNNPAALQWCRWAMAATPLAETRAVNIWNPVYTRFALAGPGQYMVRIVRGSSLNTEISGIFIDKTDLTLRANGQRGAARNEQGPVPPAAAGGNQPMPCLWGVNYCAPAIPPGYTPSGRIAAAVSLWRAARNAFGNRGFTARWPARILAYRSAIANKAPAALLARWRWKLDIWTHHDRETFDSNMNNAFAAMLWQWKGLKQFMAKDHDLQPNSGELGNGKN